MNSELKCESHHSPNSRSLMSLAACMPSSLRFFSICLLLARAARSSALIAHPIALHQLVTELILKQILTGFMGNQTEEKRNAAYRTGWGWEDCFGRIASVVAAYLELSFDRRRRTGKWSPDDCLDRWTSTFRRAHWCAASCLALLIFELQSMKVWSRRFTCWRLSLVDYLLVGLWKGKQLILLGCFWARSSLAWLECLIWGVCVRSLRSGLEWRVEISIS